MAVLADPRPALDAVLVGAVILEDPRTAEITEAWLAAPVWREALRILRGAQQRGHRLGTLRVAGDVLARAHCDRLLCDVPPPGHEADYPVPECPHEGGSGIWLPRTLAAEAVVAATEVPLAAVLADARRRLVVLELGSLGQLLAAYADAAPAVLYAAFPTLQARLAQIDTLVARYGAPIDTPDTVEAA
jgi:hypothetical protein